MAEAFVELGAEGVNWATDKHFDKVYDKVSNKYQEYRGRPQSGGQQQQQQSNYYQQDYTSKEQQGAQQSYYEQDYSSRENDYPPPQSANAGRRRQRNRLPSPDGPPPDNWDRRSRKSDNRRRDSQRSASLDRESEVSERVIRAYERERDDPSRKAESVLSKRDLRKLNSHDREIAAAAGGAGAVAGMSYANGGYGSNNLSTPTYDRRANSQQPPRSRYDDDDSDYDEKSGRRYRTTGRGYDDGYDDDRGYDREVIETERYRGPAREFDARRTNYGQSRNDPYGAGAVTQYNRRSTQEVDDYKSQRSRSRGRRERNRDRSYSDSRSRSRSREHSGIRGKLDDTFDTSMKGLGVGLAGAVVGGLAGREIGGKQHRNRDIIIGALVGGLGANAAENKWRDWKDEKERKLERDEDRWENRWDGRSRSAMR